MLIPSEAESAESRHSSGEVGHRPSTSTRRFRYDSSSLVTVMPSSEASEALAASTSKDRMRVA